MGTQHEPTGSQRALTRAWNWLTEPHPAIYEPSPRRRARLLSGLLFVTLNLGVVALLLSSSGLLGDWLQSHSRVHILLPLLLLAGTYALSRTRRHLVAAGITVTVVFASTILTVALGPRDSIALASVLLPGLVSSLLFSAPVTAAVFAASIGSVLLLAPTHFVGFAFLALATGSLASAAAAIRDRDLRQLAEQSRTLEAREGQLQQALQAEEQASRKLRAFVGELKLRNRESELRAEVGELLSACASIEEAFGLFSRVGPHLFAGQDGYLYVLRNSRDLVEMSASWGEEDTHGAARSFAFRDCLALRRGRPHRSHGAGLGVPCPHLAQPNSRPSLCVPLIAHGEVLGLLELAGTAPAVEPSGESSVERQDSAGEVLAVEISGQMALAISNLNLREQLRRQAILDPLTGLFNRRYLDATLERELRHAARRQRPLGVIMLDIDHFKRFNDTYGHQAGDEVLCRVGEYLVEHVRGGDIACRFGGDEFVLVLLEASLADTQKRAEMIVAKIRELRIRLGGRMLEPATISCGVAALPDHGMTGEEILRAADTALYEAKSQGRDGLAVAQPTLPLGATGHGEPPIIGEGS